MLAVVTALIPAVSHAAVGIPTWDQPGSVVVTPSVRLVSGVDPDATSGTVVVTYGTDGAGQLGQASGTVAADGTWSVAIDTSSWAPGTYWVMVASMPNVFVQLESYWWVLSPSSAGVSVSLPSDPVTTLAPYGYLDVTVTLPAGWNAASTTGTVSLGGEFRPGAPLTLTAGQQLVATPDPHGQPNGAGLLLVHLTGSVNGVPTELWLAHPYTLALSTRLTGISVLNRGRDFAVTANVIDWGPGSSVSVTLDGVVNTQCQVGLHLAPFPGGEPDPGTVWCPWTVADESTAPVTHLIPDGSHTVEITGVGRGGTSLDSGAVPVAVDTEGHLSIDSVDQSKNDGFGYYSGHVDNVPLTYGGQPNLTLTLTGPDGTTIYHGAPEISGNTTLGLGSITYTTRMGAALFGMATYHAEISGLDDHGQPTCAAATIQWQTVTALPCGTQTPSPPLAVTATAGSDPGTATLTITPPAFGPVTGYTATIDEPGAGATILHSTTPSFTLTALPTTTTAQVHVTADNAQGSSLPVDATLVAQHGSLLPTTAVHYATPVTVRGTITTDDVADTGTATADLEWKSPTAVEWSVLATKIMPINAAVPSSFVVVMPATGSVRTVVRGHGDDLTAVSPTTNVTVLPLAATSLAARPSVTIVKHGATVTFTATVGRVVPGMKAVLQHLVGRRWRSQATVTVPSSRHAAFRVRLSTRGKSTWRVVLPPVAGRIAGTTGRPITITVR